MAPLDETHCTELSHYKAIKRFIDAIKKYTENSTVG